MYQSISLSGWQSVRMFVCLPLACLFVCLLVWRSGPSPPLLLGGTSFPQVAALYWVTAARRDSPQWWPPELSAVHYMLLGSFASSPFGSSPPPPPPLLCRPFCMPSCSLSLSTPGVPSPYDLYTVSVAPPPPPLPPVAPQPHPNLCSPSLKAKYLCILGSKTYLTSSLRGCHHRQLAGHESPRHVPLPISVWSGESPPSPVPQSPSSRPMCGGTLLGIGEGRGVRGQE